MRKNALAMSIATLIGGLGFVGAASADVIVGVAPPGVAGLGVSNTTQLVVNNGGIGHSLITPYFTAQSNNATLISVVNTDTTNGKALKVRFRGATNSDDVLDFTLLMSPGDVWNATITAPVNGIATLATSDKSCTVPVIPSGGQQFQTMRLSTRDVKNDVASNTREGYIEIFNMADIATSSALGATIVHSNGVPKCDSATIATAILNTNWTLESDAAKQGLRAPSTGLFGDWAILNVPQTTTYSGQMVALRAQTAGGVDGLGNFVLFPQSGTAYSGTIENVTNDPIFRNDSGSAKSATGVVTGVVSSRPVAAAFFDLPDMSTPYTTIPSGLPTSPPAQTNDLSSALAVKNIMNEYMTDASIAGRTDWVYSMPTRRYQTTMDYSTSTTRQLFAVNGVVGTPQYFYTGNTTTAGQQICISAQNQTFYDREEGTKTSGAVFSPGNLQVTTFCGEVSVMSFGVGLSDPSALSAVITRSDTGSSAFTNGWGNINVLNPTTGLGLPLLGSAFEKATNPNAGAGFAGTYGLSFEHRFAR